jgi:hypothetical protein
MSLPFAVLALCSLPVFVTAGNMPLILLYTLLPVYMIHQYEEHAHGRFVEFFNSTMGRGYEVLTKVSAFWINILEVWVLFLVSFYLAKYVAAGIAFVLIYLTIFNGFYARDLERRSQEVQPWFVHERAAVLPLGYFLLIYCNGIVGARSLFNGIGLLAAVIAHAIIVVYALRRRGKLVSG